MENKRKEKEFEKIFDIKLLIKLHRFTKPFYMILALSVLAVFLSSVGDLFRPYLMKVVTDDYVTAYKNEMFVSDQSFDHKEEILFNDEYYLRDIFYEDLDTQPSYKTSRQLIKDGEDYLLLNDYIGKTTSPDTYTVDKSGQVVTLTFTEDARRVDGIVLSETDYQVFRANDISGIWFITILLLLTLVISFIFQYIQTISLNYVGQKVVYNMRKELFDHLQHLSLSYYEKNPIGRLVTRITNDMNNISEFYTNVIITFLKDFIILIGTMGIMVALDWKLSLLCFSTLPIVIIISFVFRRLVRNNQRTIKIKIAQINATLSENISGMKIIQLFNQEKHMFKAFDVINKEHLKAWLTQTNIYAILRPSMNLIYSITLCFLVYFAGSDFISETTRNVITPGLFIAFITYIQQYFRPIFDLSEKFNIMQAAMASLERIFVILEDQEKIENKPKLEVSQAFKGSIEFKNVDFSYQPDEPILKNVSFKINEGETIAIVGATGSGKTTITSLISRFYDIQSGDILIDGHPIRDIDLQELRSQISVVLQDVFLFAGSIRDNITLGEKMADEKIKEVSKFVNANYFIDKLPDTYDHILTEKGSTLSSGQRQLLSFARALAYDPSILILDEATSNIDTETELLIQDAITKLIKDRTTIIIAHRLSTIQHADKIIVMHKGEICEMGTHQELLENKGRYYDLYLLQYQEEHIS